MKSINIGKQIFIYQFLLISLHLISLSGILHLTKYIIYILGIISLISLFSQIFCIPSKTKKIPVQLKSCNVAFPSFARPNDWEEYEKKRINEETPITTPLFVTSLQLNDIINKLLNNAINEFIIEWYNEITPSRCFLYKLETTIYSILKVLIERIKKFDVEIFLVKVVIPVLNNHIIEYNLARKKLLSSNLSSSNKLNNELKISMHYNNGKLHPAVLPTVNSTEKLEFNHLRKIIEKVLPLILEKEITDSRATVLLLREIIVCKVIQPFIDLLSDPDFYNQQIVDLFERLYGKENYIQYVNEALGNKQEKKIYQQSYEQFIKMIKECNNLRNACLLRNDILSELKMKKEQIANHKSSDIVNGSKVYDIQIYINRLEVSRKCCEKRIKELGGPDFQKLSTNMNKSTSLYDVLSTPLGRYYFTQYMEHHRKIHLYNFWMEVQRLRILPEVNSNNINEIIEKGKSLSPEVNKETIRENVWKIYNTYLFPEAKDYSQKIDVSQEIIQSIEIFLYGRSQQEYLSSDMFRNNQSIVSLLPNDSLSSKSPENDYTCIFKAQKYVYEIMEKYYNKFVKSTLYFRYLHDMNSNEQYKNQVLGKKHNNNKNNINNNVMYTSSLYTLPYINEKKNINKQISNGRKIKDTSSIKSSKIKTLKKKSNFQYSKHPKRRNSGNSNMSVYTEMQRRNIPKNDVKTTLLKNISNTQNNNKLQIEVKNEKNDTIYKDILDSEQKMLLGEAINMSIIESDNSSNANKKQNIDKINKKENTEIKKFEENILPGNNKLYYDPDSLEIDTSSINNYSYLNNRRKSSHRIYYSVEDYVNENKEDINIDDMEEEIIDDFESSDDENEKSSQSINLLLSPPLSPVATCDSFSTRFSVSSQSEFHTRKKKNRIIYGKLKLRNQFSFMKNNNNSNTNQQKISMNQNGKFTEHISRMDMKLTNESLKEVTENENEWEDDDNLSLTNSNESIVKNNKNIEMNQKISQESIIENKDISNIDQINNKNKNTEEIKNPYQNKFVPNKNSNTDINKDNMMKTNVTKSQGNTNNNNEISYRGIIPEISKKILNKRIKKLEKKVELEVSRNKIFDEDDMDIVNDENDENDENKNIENDQDLKSTSSISEKSNELNVSSMHYASPGDLLVSSLIAQINETIEELKMQNKNIDELMEIAQRNNEKRRLELLKDAKCQLKAHEEDLIKQKNIYIIQEKENEITPDNVSISISDCHINNDGNKNYALYIIEINRTNVNGCTSGWIVTRRYSEFVLLHQQLRAKYWSIIHNYELPGKNVFSWMLPKPDIVNSRRIALEKYLKNLISHEEICQSIELRKFISQQNVDLPPKFKYNALSLLPTENSQEKETKNKKEQKHNTLSNKKIENKYNKLNNGSSSDSMKNENKMSNINMNSANNSNINIFEKKEFNNSIIDDNKINLNPKEKARTYENINSLNNKSSIYYDSESCETEDNSKNLKATLSLPDVKNINENKMQNSKYSFISDKNPSLNSTNSSNLRNSSNNNESLKSEIKSTIFPSDSIKGKNKKEHVASTKITDGLFDIILELFGIKSKIDWYNYLQHKAFLSFIQQLFSGTIDKKIKNTIKYLISESMIIMYLKEIDNKFWPDGEFLLKRQQREIENNKDKALSFKRTPDQIKKTKSDCNKKLTTIIPELLGGLIGKKNAMYGAEFIFELFQNKRLNQHLIYSIFDELFKYLLPEIQNELDQNYTMTSNIDNND